MDNVSRISMMSSTSSSKPIFDELGDLIGWICMGDSSKKED